LTTIPRTNWLVAKKLLFRVCRLTRAAYAKRMMRIVAGYGAFLLLLTFQEIRTA
jgi:hypothetical protein